MPDNSANPIETVSGRMTDSKRLAWLIRREAYVSEFQTVPRWGVFSSWASLEQIGSGQTPRMAIDDAIRREKQANAD